MAATVVGMLGGLSVVAQVLAAPLGPVAASGSAVILTHAVDHVSLAGHLETMSSPPGELTVGDLVEGRHAEDFVRSESAAIAFGFGDDDHWVRMRIVDRRPDPHPLVLEVTAHTVAQLDLYEVSSRGLRSVLTGNSRPFDTRDIPSELFAFSVNPEPGEVHTIYLRASGSYPVSVEPQLWDASAFHVKSRPRHFRLGAYVGVLFILALSNLLVFALLREPEYALYGGYLASTGVWALTHAGVAKQWLWPTFDLSLELGMGAPMFLVFVLLAAFTRRLLDTRTILPRLHAVGGALIVAQFVMFIPRIKIPAHAAYYPVLDLALFVWMAVVAGAALRLGSRPARFFSLALVPYLGSNVFALLREGGAVSGPRGEDIIHLGTFTMVVLLAGALAERMRILKDERGEAHARAAEILQAQGRELELQVAQRTQELSVARDAAETANRGKTAFLANMSHELRTPLNAILGYAQLLARDGAPTTSERGQIIRQSGEHLLGLINDLLDMSKAEAGRVELREDSVELAQLANSVVAWVRARPRASPLELRCVVDPTLPQWLVVDARRLRQVLLNLLDNAAKVTEKGHVELEIVRVAGTDGAAVVGFSVRDTGPGLSREDAERAFLPFERIAEGGEGDPGGTGLGLAISQRLVQLMGGELVVDTRLGQGATFSFTLELTVVRDVQAPAPTRLPIRFEGASKKVLVVDDTATGRNMLHDLLSPLGFDVTGVHNGEESLTHAQDNEVDLVLMDLLMPGMGGESAARALEKLVPDVPIIAVSANVKSWRDGTAEDTPFAAFLPKPVLHGELLDLVGRLLSLDWIYEGLAGSPDEIPDRPEAPSPDVIETLLHLAEIGNLSRVNDELDRLIAEEPRFTLFGARVKTMTASFDDARTVSFLHTYLAEASGSPES